jgi:uncharacterized protein YpmB
LLEWKSNPEKKVDHVVLGRGKPGGIWQVEYYLKNNEVNLLKLSDFRWGSIDSQLRRLDGTS